MKYMLVVTLSLILAINLSAQSDKERALEKAREAIEVMDDGNYEESIKMFEDCKRMDPTNYVFSYEIALAYTYMKEHGAAIKELKKTVKMSGINSQVFQLLGNNYSMAGQTDKAIKAYNKGLDRFAEAGNLYLEIGNVYQQADDFDQAIINYEKGIAVDPMFSSNYYRLAELYLSSTNKVPGLIYGEIFMNLERTTERTQNMSEWLYEAYDSAIHFSEDSTRIDFCRIRMVMDVESFNSGEEFELPYCAIFGKSMAIAIIMQSEVSPQSLSEMRTTFIELYYQGDAEKYPVVLFDYHKRMIEAGVFEAYNHYLFQISNPELFESWLANHRADFDQFADWYTTEGNLLEITKENAYLRHD